jgi:hypothetical protein
VGINKAVATIGPQKHVRVWEQGSAWIVDNSNIQFSPPANVRIAGNTTETENWLRQDNFLRCRISSSDLSFSYASKPLRWIDMRERIALALVLIGLVEWATGCKKQVDLAEFKSAIDKSFAGHHDCVWNEPIKLPAQVDISKDEMTRDYNALTDAGLLIRESEIKRFLGGSKQVNKYELSDKGHAAWIADPKQSGYGNFCFGHFNVTAIENATPNDPSNPTLYTVKYQYEVEGIPDWARSPDSMRTFPRIAADTSIRSATTTLVKGDNGGWVVESSTGS